MLNNEENGVVSIEYALLGVVVCAVAYMIASEHDLFELLADYWDALIRGIAPDINLLG